MIWNNYLRNCKAVLITPSICTISTTVYSCKEVDTPSQMQHTIMYIHWGPFLPGWLSMSERWDQYHVKECTYTMEGSLPGCEVHDKCLCKERSPAYIHDCFVKLYIMHVDEPLRACVVPRWWGPSLSIMCIHHKQHSVFSPFFQCFKKLLRCCTTLCVWITYMHNCNLMFMCVSSRPGSKISTSVLCHAATAY